MNYRIYKVDFFSKSFSCSNTNSLFFFFFILVLDLGWSFFFFHTNSTYGFPCLETGYLESVSWNENKTAFLIGHPSGKSCLHLFWQKCGCLSRTSEFNHTSIQPKVLLGYNVQNRYINIHEIYFGLIWTF